MSRVIYFWGSGIIFCTCARCKLLYKFSARPRSVWDDGFSENVQALPLCSCSLEIMSSRLLRLSKFERTRSRSLRNNFRFDLLLLLYYSLVSLSCLRSLEESVKHVLLESVAWRLLERRVCRFPRWASIARDLSTRLLSTHFCKKSRKVWTLNTAVFDQRNFTFGFSEHVKILRRLVWRTFIFALI